MNKKKKKFVIYCIAVNAVTERNSKLLLTNKTIVEVQENEKLTLVPIVISIYLYRRSASNKYKTQSIYAYLSIYTLYSIQVACEK